MTWSNMVGTSQPNFPNNQVNPWDYNVYLGNNNWKVGKESYYETTNLSKSALKLVFKHAKEKAWETANALNLDQTRVHQN